MNTQLAVTVEELEQLLAQEAFVQNYGFKVVSIGDGECTLHVPFQKSFERPGGFISGPIYMAAADVAMWFAILTRLGRDDMSLTSDMKTAFLNGALGEGFRCRAQILKLGRRLIYGVAECISDSNLRLTHHTVTYVRSGA